MSDIAALIERVEVSALADRGIDGELFFDFEWTGQGDEREVPEYTASLDAVVSMIEYAMPAALWDVNGYGAASVYPYWADGDVDTKFSATDPLPHIALLLAFLHAKEASA